MHQFGWLSERGGGNFLNLLQKDGGSLRKKGGVPTLEETMVLWPFRYAEINSGKNLFT